MRRVELEIPPAAAEALRETIAEAGGREVFFLARVRWAEGRDVAVVEELEVAARGNLESAPAIVAQAASWDLAIHNHPSGDLEPSEADILVASELGNSGVGFAIISNDATRAHLVVPPVRREEAGPLDPEEIRTLFGPAGPLAGHLPGYEPRPGQIEFALEVARALDEKRIVACEAGTGVGKSFAYLIPAILWATRHRRRIVVSTGTIALQEQLVGKDLPFLEKALPVSFDYALIKGRNNYACRRKLSELSQEFELTPPPEEERALLEELIAWSRTTSDGSLADLSRTIPHAVWERVMSETDKSLKVACPHYHECFYYTARARAARADIVVVNHHLFFSDLALRRQVGDYRHDLILPAYSRVIFDEAHHLEDIAAEHLGIQFSRSGIHARFARVRSRDGTRGRYVYVAKRLQGAGDATAATAIAERYAPALSEAGERIDEALGGLAEHIAKAVPEEAAEGPTVRLRRRPSAGREGVWERVAGALAGVVKELESAVGVNDRILAALDRSSVSEEIKASLRLEAKSFGLRLEALIADIESFLELDDPSRARWLELDAGRERPALRFAALPIRIAEDLEAALYEPLDAVIFTSATLSVAGAPDFIAGRLGLDRVDPDRFGFREFASPFDYPRQALLALPDDLPPPGDRRYEEALPGAILGLLKATRGRAFVLFTSYSLLRRTYAGLEEEIRRLGWRPLAQGEAQRSELLDRFRSGNAVLFGTDSFWEGVDVPGEALSAVIITRLPFRVPTDPLEEARVEDLEARGGNAFMDYSLPRAVLKLKQGFGRLVRTASDRGVVAVLDTRIVHKRYGTLFLRSLPPAARVRAPFPEVVEAVRRFFAEPPPVSETPDEPPARAGRRAAAVASEPARVRGSSLGAAAAARMSGRAGAGPDRADSEPSAPPWSEEGEAGDEAPRPARGKKSAGRAVSGMSAGEDGPDLQTERDLSAGEGGAPPPW